MIYLLFEIIQLVLLYYTCLLGVHEQAPMIIYSSEELLLTLQDGEERNTPFMQISKLVIFTKNVVLQGKYY